MVLAAKFPKLYGFQNKGRQLIFSLLPGNWVQNNLDFEDLFWEQLSFLGQGLSKIFFASFKQIFHSDFSQVAFPLVLA